MRPYVRAMIRLLFAVAFLLLIAWAGLKIMQRGFDLEDLLHEAQRALERVGSGIGTAAEKVQSYVQPLLERIGPAIEDATERLRELFPSL